MLGDKLRDIFDKLSNKRVITSDLIDNLAKEMQRALILSDVNIELVLDVSNRIKSLRGENIPLGVEGREYLIKRVYDILLDLISFKSDISVKPKTILVTGLFGSGKTTTCVKIANYYKKKGFDVGIIGADTFRMAALEQLKQYGSQFDVFGDDKLEPHQVVVNGLKYFEKKDIVIVDSAGRSSLDDILKEELKKIVQVLEPELNLLVLSADIGQIALTQALEFNNIYKLNGIVLTKMDGSSKGGGALASCSKLEIPVLFLGTGEKVSDFEEFDATRYLSRVMGYGDLQGLIDKVSDLEIDDVVDDEFNFNTFKKQLSMTKKIGSLGKIANMMGFGSMISADAEGQVESHMNKFTYIIDSMTKYERLNPDVLNSSRINRIAKGSGTNQQDVRLLIKQYRTMKDAMNTFRGKDVTKFNEKDVQGIFKKQFEKKAKRKLRLR